MPCGSRTLAPPIEIELTSDFAPENLSEEKRHLVDQYCDGRFYQAAVYDYTQYLHEVFEYSRFFENNASKMQLSFHNVHEMLRFILESREAGQIQKLTAYFHTEEFFNDTPEEVKLKIRRISEEMAIQKSFSPESSRIKDF